MPERKYDRPSYLKAIALPGATAGDAAQACGAFVGHIRDGLAERRYVRGDILPTVCEVRGRYGLTEEDVHSAIRELRRAGLLQLHDEFRDTYFLDPGPEALVGETHKEELLERVKRLEDLYRDLGARVEAIDTDTDTEHGGSGRPGDVRP